MSIRTKLQLILVLLFVFIVGLVGLNFFTFNELKGDAPAVNASGSLRMRAYQLSWGAARRVMHATMERLISFQPAEEEHQGYLQRHPEAKTYIDLARLRELVKL